MNGYIDESWLDEQTNRNFIRYILTDADTISVRRGMHRAALRSIVSYYGMVYLDLTREEVNAIFVDCLSGLLIDLQWKKIDLERTNLHRHFFDRCKSAYFAYIRQLRKDALAESRRIKG
jgi:hypothetical protein